MAVEAAETFVGFRVVVLDDDDATPGGSGDAGVTHDTITDRDNRFVLLVECDIVADVVGILEWAVVVPGEEAEALAVGVEVVAHGRDEGGGGGRFGVGGAARCGEECNRARVSGNVIDELNVAGIGVVRIHVVSPVVFYIRGTTSGAEEFEGGEAQGSGGRTAHPIPQGGLACSGEIAGPIVSRGAEGA